MTKQVLLLIVSCSLCACTNASDYDLSGPVPPIGEEREAKVLSAFFGLDNALPISGQDGMPLVFSHEIEPSTLDAADFEITTSKGEIYTVDRISLRPADEAYELRTVLLIGEYGNAPNNEPVEVEISGDLMAPSGQNFKGQKVAVTPLSKGPFVSYAEYFTIDDSYPYVEKGEGHDCPKSNTTMVVRSVWAGGVRATNGEELGEKDLQQFTVTLERDSTSIDVHPFQIADTGDNDNNIDLCLKEKGIPVSLSVKANTAIDPRDDANDFTSIKPISRW